MTFPTSAQIKATAGQSLCIYKIFKLNVFRSVSVVLVIDGVGGQVRFWCLGCWHVRRPSGNEADKHQQGRADNRSGPKTRNLKPAETHCELSASKRFWSHCLRYQDVITDANKPAHT